MQEYEKYQENGAFICVSFSFAKQKIYDIGQSFASDYGFLKTI